MNSDRPADDGVWSMDAPVTPRSPARLANEVFVFSLFIAGMGPLSQRAVDNMTRLCNRYLADRYELQVVDIYQQPELARDERVLAVPTVIKKLPYPMRQFIGDFADTEKVLLRLGIRRLPG